MFAPGRTRKAASSASSVPAPGAQNALPSTLNAKHAVSVHAHVPKGGAEGVLFCMGGNDGGFVLYIKDGKLTYGYNYVGLCPRVCLRS